MALGDSIVTNTQSRSAFEAQSSKLRGEAFDTILNFWMSNSNILTHLQGDANSGRPFVIRQDLAKGGMDTVNITVVDELGASGRRGDDIASGYEETPAQNSFPVVVDVLRVVIGWNELTAWAAAAGKSWKQAYPALTGKRIGQIEQEDMLMKMRQRSSSLNTVRPGGRSSLDTIVYTDTIDTASIDIGYNILTSNGAAPASIGTMAGGMPLNKYVALGSNFALTGLFQDPTFTSALLHASVDGKENAFWTNDIPDYNGLAFKRWNVQNHSNPGPIGSSIICEALLGDAITSATTTFTVYGGGRTQATLDVSNVLYKPFEYFYGNDKLFGKAITYFAGSPDNSTVYYFLVVDPADQKWAMYSYTGASAFGANGHDITITQRLHSSTTGAAVTTLGNVVYNATYNKVAFPTGSRIIQCNANGVPICDIYLFGSNAGAKCYGMYRNQRISNLEFDYGERIGLGTKSIYGTEMMKDTLNQYHRGFVRIQAAYKHPLGNGFAQLAPP